MKTLQNISLDAISALSMDQALEFKNKFLCYEIKNSILKLTFFLNPRQSFSRHEAAATRKFKELYKMGAFTCKAAALVDIDRNVDHLHTYVYKIK